MKNKILILIIIIVLGACNLNYIPVEPVATQTPSATQTQEPTQAPILTTTPSPEPVVVPTATDMPTTTVTPTEIPFPGPTPTQITTLSIIEATPLGGYPTEQTSGLLAQDYEGIYVPNSLRNVRKCAAVGNVCPVIRQIKEGELVKVYSLLYVYPQKDVWVCLDPPPALYVSTECKEVAAYLTGDNVWGTLYLGWGE